MFFLRLRHRNHVISGLAKKIHFKNVGWCFVRRFFKQYISMVLLPPNYASGRVMQILRKSMSVIVTSNFGNCDFKFNLHCVNQVALHGLR